VVGVIVAAAVRVGDGVGDGDWMGVLDVALAAVNEADELSVGTGGAGAAQAAMAAAASTAT